MRKTLIYIMLPLFTLSIQFNKPLANTEINKEVKQEISKEQQKQIRTIREFYFTYILE